MDFGFSDEQEMLRQTAHDFLAENCPTTFVRQMMEDDQGYAPALWKKMADLGWLGLAFPEEYGGQGLGFVDLTVILEEMGAALLPSPFFFYGHSCRPDHPHWRFRSAETRLSTQNRRWFAACHAGHDRAVRPC